MNIVNLLLPRFVQKFCIKMLIYADQHFSCNRDASKGVEVPHGSLRIRDQVLILDTPVPVSWEICAVVNIT